MEIEKNINLDELGSSMEGSLELGFDSAMKVIEVTAKEIVDRINNPDLENGPMTPKNKSSRTSSQTSILELNKILTPSVTASGSAGIVDEKKESEKKTSIGTSVPISPSQTLVSNQHKTRPQFVLQNGAQKLLGQIQNWVKESNELSKSGKQAESFLSSGLRDNMYYLYSIESFVRDLTTPSQEALGLKFSSNLINWIKQLFHFRDNSDGGVEYNGIFAHWEKFEGLVAMTKWSLHVHFPNFFYGGYDTFPQEDRFPVIYCSDEDIGVQVTASLGLSKECISLVDTTHPDWVNSLEQLILFDNKRNLTPVILLLNIVSKNFEKGCRLAEVYKLPIHIYGRNTFSYFVKRTESDQVGSSITIDLNTWIPSPPLPILTIFKKPPKSELKRLQVCGLSSINRDLMTFAPWFSTQAFGHTNTKSYVEEVCERGQFLLTILKKYDFLAIVPNWSTLTDGQVIVSSLIFRFKPKAVVTRTQSSDSSSMKSETDQQPSMQYVNVLNSWLYHILERDMKDQIHVEFVDVKGSWNILFDIFKTDKFSSEDEEFIEKMFEHHMKVLESTVSKKSEFGRLVKESMELEGVDYESSWAGLGAVRYIPKFYREVSDSTDRIELPAVSRLPPPVPTSEDLVLHRKSNINHLNAQIVDKLKSIDNAFSLGVYGESDWCVQFGMVTDETEVSELLRLVISSGEEIEESSEFFHQMSELVKKGIEKATEELKRESEEALWEEGILRRVPVVGTFVNWWSPPPREAGIRGRALNLVQGKVESTENIYKYHMQVETPSSPTATSTAILNKISRGSITK